MRRTAVTSQTALVELLARDGIPATQATVSRDLEDLGAIKVRGANGDTVYAIPELPAEQRAPEDHLRRVFGDWVVEVAHSGNLVVLRTPPGSAHVVGSALDRSRLPEVLGTVAGDDTLIVVVTEEAGGLRMATRLRCGTVTINETYAVGWGSVAAPMGGFKDSGIGRRHGIEGILKYTESQNVTLQHGPAIVPPPGVPASAFARWFTGALRAARRVPGIK